MAIVSNIRYDKDLQYYVNYIINTATDKCINRVVFKDVKHNIERDVYRISINAFFFNGAGNRKFVMCGVNTSASRGCDAPYTLNVYLNDNLVFTFDYTDAYDGTHQIAGSGTYTVRADFVLNGDVKYSKTFSIYDGFPSVSIAVCPINLEGDLEEI